LKDGVAGGRRGWTLRCTTPYTRIDPNSGTVTGWLELKHLFPQSIRRNREAVLNGIAWDDENNRLYITGKLWPSLFEITYDGLPDSTRF